MSLFQNPKARIFISPYDKQNRRDGNAMWLTHVTCDVHEKNKEWITNRLVLTLDRYTASFV